MTIFERLNKLDQVKFSFGKSDEFHPTFCRIVGALSMYDNNGYGLGIPISLSPGNQLMGVFNSINSQGGTFVFNINGVDILRAFKGFANYDEAASQNMITEWELSIILNNKDFLDRTIFHNGKVEFPQILNGIEKKWN
ncbi:hypothetical protein VR611_06200 [Aquirufa nivalisilvae]